MHRLLAEGLSQVQVAEALGLSVKTIGRWASRRSVGLVSTDAPGQLLPVRLAAGPDVADGHAHPVLLTPAGHRVTGLSLYQLAVLLRMLG
jgi:hypothetical protein